MTTLEDTIRQYEQKVIKIRRDADLKILEIEKHIIKLKKRLENQSKQNDTTNTNTH